MRCSEQFKSVIVSFQQTGPVSGHLTNVKPIFNSLLRLFWFPSSPKKKISGSLAKCLVAYLVCLLFGAHG